MRQFPAYKLSDLGADDGELLQLLKIEAMGGGPDLERD
jgi:hypothetical protein